MDTIRLFMNGELPMIAPVSGLRSGAPGGSVSSAMNGDDAEQPEQGEAQAALLVGRQRCSRPPST